jgi:hypothetical protein
MQLLFRDFLVQKPLISQHTKEKQSLIVALAIMGQEVALTSSQIQEDIEQLCQDVERAALPHGQNTFKKNSS